MNAELLASFQTQILQGRLEQGKQVGRVMQVPANAAYFGEYYTNSERRVVLCFTTYLNKYNQEYYCPIRIEDGVAKELTPAECADIVKSWGC